MKLWTEVNLFPFKTLDFPGEGYTRENLLTEVVAPLLADLHPAYDAWFYFWESDLAGHEDADDHIRLRFRWADRAEPELLRESLDRAVKSGLLLSYHEGNHGVRGEMYEGEADAYGAAAWDVTVAQWTRLSELALELVKLSRENALVHPRSFHWRRLAHLFANQLGLDDIKMCLFQAQRYLEITERTDPVDVHMMNTIDMYLNGGDII